MRRDRFSVILLILATAALVALWGGCSGGGGGVSGGASPGAGYGRLVLVFPNPQNEGGGKAAILSGTLKGGGGEIMKSIPQGTSYFIVNVIDSSGAQAVSPVTVSFAAGQTEATATIDGIAAGSYTVKVTAYNSAGNSLGTGSMSVSVTAGASSPVTVSITPSAGKKVYVCNSSDGTVSVIDTATNTVVDTIVIPVNGSAPQPEAVDFTPSGDRAVVADYTQGKMHVIDTSTDTVVTSVAGVSQPGAVTFRPNQTNDGTGFITNGGTSIWEMYMAGPSISAAIDIGAQILHVSMTNNGQYAFLSGANWVKRYNRTSAPPAVDDDWSLGATLGTARWSMVSPGNSYVYFAIDSASGYNDYVGMFSTSGLNDGQINSCDLGMVATPTCIAFHPDGTRIYVTNKDANTVTVINAATMAPIATIPGFSTPVRIAAHPQGTWLYVTNRIAAGTVSVIDPVTNTINSTISVGTNPIGIEVLP